MSRRRDEGPVGRPGTGRSADLVALLGRPGDVPMRIWPVSDHERLSRLIALLTQIGGVDGVTVERFDGRAVLLVAHVARPAAIAPELALRLDRGLVGCGLRDGRVEVQLVPRSTGAPDPPAGPGAVVPPGLRAHHIPGPPPAPESRAGGRPRTTTPRPTGPGGAPGTRARPKTPPPTGPSAAPREGERPDAGAGAEVGQAAELVGHALRSLLGVSLLVCDTELRIRSVAGPAWPQRPGSTTAGRGVREVLAREAWRALAPALLTALGGATETIEFDGEVAGSRFAATCTPVIDDGSVIGATAVARDVAIERGDQLALRALQDKFGAVFEHSPVGQGLLSVGGRWVRVNGRLCELLGETPDELLGQDAGRALHPDDRQRDAHRFRMLLAGRTDGLEVDLRVAGARGHVSTVRAHVSVLRTPDGWPRGAIVQVAHGDG